MRSRSSVASAASMVASSRSSSSRSGRELRSVTSASRASPSSCCGKIRDDEPAPLGHVAGVGGLLAREDAQERRLSAPVRPDHPQAHARLDVEVEPVEDLPRAEALPDPACREKRHAPACNRLLHESSLVPRVPVRQTGSRVLRHEPVRVPHGTENEPPTRGLGAGANRLELLRAAEQLANLLIARARQTERPGEITYLPRHLRRRCKERRAGDVPPKAIVDPRRRRRAHKPSVQRAALRLCANFVNK